MTGDPYNRPLKRKRRIPENLQIVLGVSFVFLIFIGAVFYFSKEDSGIAACKALADRGRTAAATSDSPMSRDDYLRLRKVFKDSDRDDIRQNGSAFVDITWQVANMQPNDPLILVYANQIVTSYTNLSAACADNGVPLPSLSDLTAARESASPSPRSTN